MRTRRHRSDTAASLDDLTQLSALLYFREESGCSATIHTLLNEIRRATAMIRGGGNCRTMSRGQKTERQRSL